MIDLIKERRLPTATYPLRGFVHLLRHPKQHAGPIMLSILKVMATSTVVVYPMYKLGYDSQRAVIASLYKSSFESPFLTSVCITVTSSLLFFLESSAVTLQLASYFIGNIRNRLFDSVLKERKGLPTSQDTSAVADVAAKVAGSEQEVTAAIQKHAFLSPTNLMILSAQLDDSWSITLLRPAVFVMTLPLNIIPVVGPICFVAIQALFRGGMAHRRYFQLYQWSPNQRQRRVETHFWQYQRFGMMAAALEMVPFVGYVFMYTNQIGAAIWAMDLHDRKLLEPVTYDNGTSKEKTS